MWCREHEKSLSDRVNIEVIVEESSLYPEWYKYIYCNDWQLIAIDSIQLQNNIFKIDQWQLLPSWKKLA